MKQYLQDVNEVFHDINATDSGLSSDEAEIRLTTHGKNKLVEPKKVSILRRFLNQLKDPMIIILLVAAVVSGVLAIIEKEFPTDVIIIMCVVLLNSILGVVQENKAENAIEALKKMTAATSKVIRDNKLEHIKSEDLVVGDIVILEAGDAVPADCRIIECASLKIEESALTGESVPVNKQIERLTVLSKDADVSLGDRKNMVYMGSSVVYGRGRAVVVATGMDTEMGKIANVISNTMDDATPLQKKLNGLSKILTYLVIGICVFIFVFTLIKTGDFGAASIINTFMIAISLAVAAIPEGLATVVTIVLSIGVTKMSKRNAVVRKLTAVEALGCTQVICSDKTGTLTQNKMTVVDSYTTDKCLLAKSMALCSDSELDENNDATGEPTENALVNFAYKENLPKPELKKQEPRVSEAPFDSMRKMMSTLHQKDGIVVQYTKGAPDELLKVCSFALEKGKIVPLTDKIKQEILAQNKHMADKALRVLASAYKEYPTIPTDVSPEKIEKDLIFIGLVGMIDPIRPEVKDAIALCRTAGIRPVMITGDHRDTAIAIAKELGIIENAEQAITGAELDTISDEQLALDIEKYAVYARVQPEHKVRIVNAWKKENKITAMTGDGVNDAPSIKSADIGIGMGITGTDVTKNVADMILADDNFATIVTAVEEGRKIYDNIRKAIQFLLSSNLSEVFAIFFASIVGFTILKPVHILWINLITDSLPAIALGLEKGDSDIMERAPRSSKDGIFAGGLGIDVVYQGFLVAALTVFAYIVGNVIEHGRWTFEQSNDGITMAFLALSMSEIFHSFNMRSQRHSIITKKDHNKYLYGAMLLALLLTTTIVYVPFLAKVFEFTAISATEYFIAMAISFSIIPIVEIVKLFQRLFNKNRMKKLNKSNI